MNDDDASFMFVGKLKEFEQTIVDFLVKDAKLSGKDPDTTLIYLYILIHQKLTQKQLAELTKFPKSKISKLTSDMVDRYILQKQFIEGTHTNLYFLIEQPFQLNKIPIDHLLYSYEHPAQLYKKLIKRLEEINPKDNLDAQILMWRIYDLLLYFEGSRAVIREYFEKSHLDEFEMPNLYPNHPILNQTYRDRITSYLKNEDSDLPELMKFKDEVRIIEDELLDFLLEGIFKKEKPSLELIMGYFITRGKLTQKQLKKLTGFSAGTISQGINDLLAEDKIKIIPRTQRESHAKIYVMESVSKNFLSQNITQFEEMLIWVPRFEKIKEELNSTKNNMLLLNGYFAIYTITDKILTILLPRYKRYYEQQKKLLSLLDANGLYLRAPAQ